MSFFPDGERVFGADEADGIGVWDAESGRLLASHDDEVLWGRPATDDWVVVKLNGPLVHWRRARPERWWGVFWLWHFWLIVALALALVASGWQDIKRMKGRAPACAAPGTADGQG